MRYVRDERNDEFLASAPARYAEMLRGIHKYHREEGCFKGYGELTAFDLNPNLALSDRLCNKRRF